MKSKTPRTLTTLAALSSSLLVGCGSTTDVQSPAAQSEVPASSAASQTEVSSAVSVADGVYKADGPYRSPAGDEMIHVTLDVKAGRIANAIVVGDATHPKSRRFQDGFIAEIASAVVGTSIEDVALTAVSGASLTTIGFMKAVEAVKADATK